ncbi:MAG: MFS transporter [Chromatiales bacterium]|nr:MAG: MFS transporter [Chromatiales bacterium]
MILLTVAYVFNFVDRYILGLLVEPIKADLGLSDTQMGLLIGPAFAVLYAAAGLPLGWLADRTRRTLILGCGVALWSLATAASSLARNFSQLFLARVGVGVGEATLAPCALSMISDSFPPERRGRPIAFYTAAQSLGAGLAALGGAAVLGWANSVDQLQVPVLGEVKPWQFTFIVVGLPGLFVALLLLLSREPARQERAATQTGASIGETLDYLWRRRAAYLSFVAFPLVMTTVAYSQTFFAALYMRTWNWPIERFALWSGLALVIIGPITVNVAGWLSDRLYKNGRPDGPVQVMLAGSLLLIVMGAVSPLMPTGELAFSVWLFNLVGMSTVSAAAPIALLNIVPATMRGQGAALFYMITSLGGLLIGPTAVGLLSDYVFGESGIQYATALVPALFGIPVLLFTGYARRRYLAECNAAAGEAQADRG